MGTRLLIAWGVSWSDASSDPRKMFKTSSARDSRMKCSWAAHLGDLDFKAFSTSSAGSGKAGKWSSPSGELSRDPSPCRIAPSIESL